MLPLDRKEFRTLIHLHKSLKHKPPSDLLLAEFEDKVVVTDGAILLEWPKEMVDTESPAYHRLATRESTTRRLITEDWRKRCFGDMDMVDGTELEPDFSLEGTTHIGWEGGSALFQSPYIEVAEHFMDRLFPFKVVPVDNIRTILAVLDYGDIVGAVLNLRP